MIAEILRSGIRDGNLPYKVEILKNIYRSANYYTDDYKGVCEDGDYRAIRYVNAENGRVFKMKIGKLYRKLILETAFGRTLPEQVITYLCEEIAQEWQTFTMDACRKTACTSIRISRKYTIRMNVPATSIVVWLIKDSIRSMKTR